MIDREKKILFNFNTNASLIFKHCSPHMHYALGYSSLELIGASVSSIVTEEGRREFENGIAKLNENHDECTLFDCQFAKKNGGIVSLPVRVVSVYSAANELEGFCVLALETETQRDKKSTYSYNDQLKRAIDHAQSMEAKAEAAVLVKSQFIANMSHEIRTPLNGILGIAQLLKTSSLSEEQNEYTDLIIKSGGLLLSIVNGILDFSKAETGTLKLEKVKFSIRSVIQNCLELQEQKARDKGLTLTSAVHDTIPEFLYGDPVRLGQICVNLINNAIKFTPAGEVRIEVATVKVFINNILLKIRVHDTGIGIEKEKISKLFRSFTQLDSSLTKEFGGTGLGLSIAKRLVEMMHGEIGVDSIPGEGTTFWFTVPFALENNKDTRDNNSEQSQSGLPTSEGNRVLSILFVDDSQINRHVGKMMIEKMNCTVDEANDGIDALSKLRQKAYDVVFMDLNMPKLDGFETIKKIRDNTFADIRPDIPVIGVTAHALNEDRDKCLKLGMNDYIPKPLSPAAIQIVLERFRSGTPVAQVSSEKNVEVHSKTDEPFFDSNKLFSKLAGDIELFRTLIDTFYESFSSDLMQLKDAWREKSIRDMEMLGHKIKGSCSNMHVKVMSEEGLGIEMGAKNNTVETVPKHIEKLSEFFEQFKIVAEQEYRRIAEMKNK